MRSLVKESIYLVKLHNFELMFTGNYEPSRFSPLFHSSNFRPKNLDTSYHIFLVDCILQPFVLMSSGQGAVAGVLLWLKTAGKDSGHRSVFMDHLR